MYNFKLNNDNDDNYVLYFEYGKLYSLLNGETVQDDVIIIHFADNHLEYVDDTNENREMLMNILKTQMRYSSQSIPEIKKVNLYSNILKYGFYCSTLVSLVYSLNSFKEGQYILFVLLTSLSLYSFYMWRYYANTNKLTYDMLDDYDKNMFYLENQSKFNVIDYSDENIFKGLKKKNIRYLNRGIKDEIKINPNSIDSLSKKDLKMIINNSEIGKVLIKK